MAVRIGRTFLLLLGFIFLANKNPVLAVADAFEQANEAGKGVQQTPNGNAIHVKTSPYNVVENISEVREEHSALQTRGFTIPGGVRIISDNAVSKQSVLSTGIHIGTGGRIDVKTGEPGGLIIRGDSRDHNQIIMIRNNKLFVGKTLVCPNLSKTEEQATYQKSKDGTMWYTNVKVGEPMLQAEIKTFEEEWLQYPEDKAKRDAEKDAQWKRENEEKVAQRKQRMENRRKAREESSKRRREERERLRKERAKKLEQKRKEKEEKARSGKGRRSSSIFEDDEE